MKMMWPTLAVALICAVLVAEAKPVDESTSLSTELKPVDDEDTTLATELKPPPLPEFAKEKLGKTVLFLINLYAVKNETDGIESKEVEILKDNLTNDHPELKEPLATILLVVEADEEDKAVDLDQVAKDLEAEGFKVEKIEKDGLTKLIKVDVDLDDLEDAENLEDALEEEIIKPQKLTKVRRKRHLCLKCKLAQLKAKHSGGGYGGGYGGGCNGGCGGGYRPQQPVYYPEPQPVYHPPPRPVYHPQPSYPVQNGCNTCGGGNGGSYSQASAQASAQASSGSYGKK